MAYPAADDPLLPEAGPTAALEYRPAETKRPRHSRLGLAALAAALLSPMTMLGVAVMFSVATPPRLGGAVHALLNLAFWGGPVAGLALGTTALLLARRAPRRRWPAVVAVTLGGLMIALWAVGLFLLIRNR